MIYNAIERLHSQLGDANEYARITHTFSPLKYKKL